MLFLDGLIIFLAISFLFYGFSCLFTQHMIDEFNRYGVPQFRRLIGALEVSGGVGLLVGYFVPFIQILAACGLALLMLCGCLLRIKIRDSLIQILPAFTFLLVSLYVLFKLSV